MQVSYMSTYVHHNGGPHLGFCLSCYKDLASHSATSHVTPFKIPLSMILPQVHTHLRLHCGVYFLSNMITCIPNNCEPGSCKSNKVNLVRTLQCIDGSKYTFLEAIVRLPVLALGLGLGLCPFVVFLIKAMIFLKRVQLFPVKTGSSC